MTSTIELRTPQEKYQAYRHLPSTAVALATLEDRKAHPTTPPEPLLHLERRLADCLERDKAQTERPEGCWCFGAGADQSPARYILTHFDDDEPKLYGAAFCDCPDGQNARATARSEYLIERADSFWHTSGIPLRFLPWRLGTSPLKDRSGVIVQRLSADPNGSYLFWGNYGVGKTGLAVGVAWGWVQMQCTVEQGLRASKGLLFRSVPDLLTELRATYNTSDGPTEADVLQRYASVPLLVLDDLGAEQIRSTGWVEDRLYQIIGRRHANMLPIYVTSNLSPEELGLKIGERIVWRLLEMTGPEGVVHVEGPNLRDVVRG